MIQRGISFNDIHSYYDLNLILSSAYISPAKPKTNYVDIAGGDGSIDLTEAHGEVKYHDRDCKFVFTMNPAGDLSDVAYERKKTEISNLLNGKTFKIKLHKDGDYYYEGRCTVDEFLSNKRIRQFVITARVKPYKFKQKVTVLNFNLTSTPKVVNIRNSRRTVTPVLECNGNANIEFGSSSFAMNNASGTVRFLSFQLKEGNNQITISGSGTLTMTYQEGDL